MPVSNGSLFALPMLALAMAALAACGDDDDSCESHNDCRRATANGGTEGCCIEDKCSYEPATACIYTE